MQRNSFCLLRVCRGSPSVCCLEDKCLCILFQVMVSNPHALGFKANFSEFGNTFDGNSKYKLVCVLC